MLGGGVWWEEEKNSVLGPNSKFASGSPFQGQKGVVVQTKAFICKTRNVKKIYIYIWRAPRRKRSIFTFVCFANQKP